MQTNKGKYLTITYGCQMSEHDSERIAGMLEDMGYVRARDEEDADVIMVSTCTVRDSADQKIWGKLGELKRLKARRPHLVLGISGCMVQAPGVAGRLAERAPYLDVILGTHNLNRFPALLEQARQQKTQALEIWDAPQATFDDLPTRHTSRYQAYVDIMYGCNHHCSFCIVPTVRGRQRDRTPAAIVQEVKDLVANGYKEVTLLGQNVNAYGRTLPERYDFADLLRDVNATGIPRIRFTSPHPLNFSPRVIEAMAESEHVCEHVHLPLQAGSDRVLRAMRRGYTHKRYLDLVEALRAAIPGIAITTDIIVGFPGETEADFQETLAVMDKAQLDGAFTFLYSPRTGTPAAAMPQVPDEVKHDRLNRLNALQNSISRRVNERMVGQTVEVLVEGPSKTNADHLEGRTRTNKIVIFDSPEELAGQFVLVKITTAQTFYLIGEMIARA